MERRMIVPPGMREIVARFRYAPGVLVGDTLFINGQVGRDEQLRVVADNEAQFDQCFRNRAKVPDATGFGIADLVEPVKDR